ncbi:hypothetical protein [Geodermatophilus sabuli]|uniref:hypothetical protein n=1 Tax=Geodermatophilus sabuli TaxID=1564158 RepID=UPI00117B12C6|nr:hypothetical protein [Geodermatophilus sabuli]MBB3086514.1 hypothetical protein [Geodermatophilus sabuli]
MGEVVLALEVLGVLLLVPAGYAWLGARARRRGIGGSVMAPFEEIWDPRAHTTHIEVQVQAERAAPAATPGDRPAPDPQGA